MINDITTSSSDVVGRGGEVGKTRSLLGIVSIYLSFEGHKREAF